MTDAIQKDLIDYEPQLIALAQRLVRDPHVAEDLVQETYVSALERGLPTSPGFRRWLRETLRLKARSIGEQEDRRRAREQEVAAWSSDSNGDDADRELILRAVAEDAMSLAEPYGSTLRARYFEGMSPQQIAQQQGVPARTIYTRIARGLKQLRERLDRRFDARRWRAALALLAIPRTDHTQPPGPATVFTSSRFLLVVAGLVVAIGTWLAWSDSAGRPASWMAISTGSPLAAAEETSRPTVAERSTIERDSVEPSDRGTVAPAPNFRGVVHDTSGSPVVGIEVVVQVATTDSSEVADALDFRSKTDFGHTRSRDDGSFDLYVPPLQMVSIEARGNGMRPVVSEMLRPTTESRALELVVAPQHTFRGVVRGPDGAPLEGVTVTLRAPVDFLASMRRTARTWTSSAPSCRSDASGLFELDGYAMPAVRLEFEMAGFAQRTVTLEQPTRSAGIEVALTAQAALEGTVTGKVVDELDQGIAAARLIFGRHTAAVDRDGTFELDLAHVAETGTIWTVAPERLPARFDLPRSADGRLRPPLEPVVLRPTGEPLSLSGRVLDADGEPVANALVWLDGPTVLGTDLRTWFAESWMDPTRRLRPPFHLHTARDGSFEIPFLLARDYRCGALIEGVLTSTVSEAVPAGTSDLELRLPTDRGATPMSGHVVAKDGTPIPDVRITVVRITGHAEVPDRRPFRFYREGPTSRSGEDGAFGLAPFAAEGCRLLLSGEGVLTDDHAAPPSFERSAYRIVAGRPARLRVDATTDHAEATRFGLFGRDGEPALLRAGEDYDRSDLAVAPVETAPLTDGGSEMFVAPDTALEIVFYRGESELGRHPIELDPAITNELRF